MRQSNHYMNEWNQSNRQAEAWRFFLLMLALKDPLRKPGGNGRIKGENPPPREQDTLLLCKHRA